METKVLTIKGMTCDHCKMAVKKALESLEGVEAADVDLKGGKATVTLDLNKVSNDAIKGAVDEAGYEAVV